MADPHEDPAIYKPDGLTRADWMRLEWEECSGPQCDKPTWTSKNRGIAGLCFACHKRAGYQYFLGDQDWRRNLVLFNAIRGNEQFLGLAHDSRGLWKTSDKQFYWSTKSIIDHSDSSPDRCGIGWEPPTGLIRVLCLRHVLSSSIPTGTKECVSAPPLAPRCTRFFALVSASEVWPRLSSSGAKKCEQAPPPPPCPPSPCLLSYPLCSRHCGRARDSIRTSSSLSCRRFDSSASTVSCVKRLVFRALFALSFFVLYRWK